MQQHAPSFLGSCIPAPGNAAAAKSVYLTAQQAATLSLGLAEDAKGALYSSVICVADAFSGLQNGYFSWATVKLYYACFYLAKAALARRGHCIFYASRTPMSVEAVAGAVPAPHRGNSHTVVTSLYKAIVKDGFLNAMPIDGIHAFDWMTDHREEINYKEIRFPDPSVPPWFGNVDSLGLRRVIHEYILEPMLYAFDASHAMVALPLAALQSESRSTRAFHGLGLNVSESETLRRLFVDRAGPIPHVGFL